MSGVKRFRMKNKNVKRIKERIKELYVNFFKELNVDKKEGLMKDINVKFATYPYIGSNYGKTKKILFVGQSLY